MGWKKLVVIGSVFLFVSCLSFYHHPKGGFRPKKPNFSLAKEKFVYGSLIDTLSIYIKTDTTKYGKYRSLPFIKFYNNGRVFISSKSVKDVFTYDNFRPLDIGYYLINNDNILIETFVVNPRNKNDTEYVLEKGFVRGDSIIIKNKFIKDKKDIYIKQKLNFIPEPSNW